MRIALPGFASGTKDDDRRSIVLLLFILLAVGLCSLLHAVSNPFWYDEICTIVVCRLSSASEIWKALNHAADTNPPFYYLVARFTRQLIPEDHLGYRVPSILGLMGTITCIYFILSRRTNRLAALVGATFVLCTPLADYAYEARPYSLMIACISCAILAWQRIEDSRLYAFLLAISLAAAVSLHYYAVLVFPVFMAGETSVWIFHRRFRAGAWASIVAGALPILVFSKLLLKLRQYYGQNFWAHPSFRQIVSTDSWLFNMAGNWGLVIVIGVSAVILYYSLNITAAPIQPGHKEGECKVLPIEERVLILMLLWLPLMAIAVAKIGHGGMTARYMMPTILGGALALGYLTGKMPRAAVTLLLVLLMMYYALSSFAVLNSALTGTLLKPRIAASHEMQTIVVENDDSGLPVVISNGIRYLSMTYYTPASSSRIFYSIADPAAALRYSANKSDSVDLALLQLRQYFPLQVEEYDGFVSRHREFLLVTDPAGGLGGGFEWLPARLIQDGNTVMLHSAKPGTNVYKVTMKP
jgi:hypothetical protein